MGMHTGNVYYCIIEKRTHLHKRKHVKMNAYSDYLFSHYNYIDM